MLVKRTNAKNQNVRVSQSLSRCRACGKPIMGMTKCGETGCQVGVCPECANKPNESTESENRKYIHDD